MRTALVLLAVVIVWLQVRPEDPMAPGYVFLAGLVTLLPFLIYFWIKEVRRESHEAPK